MTFAYQKPLTGKSVGVDGNWSMVAMYAAWIINCIYGWYNWSKLNQKASA